MVCGAWKDINYSLSILDDPEFELRGEVIAVRSKETDKIEAFVWKVFHMDEKVMQGTCNFSNEAKEKVEALMAKLQRGFDDI